MLKKVSNAITSNWKPILIGSALSGVTSALTFTAANNILHYFKNKNKNKQRPNVNIIIIRPNNKNKKQKLQNV